MAALTSLPLVRDFEHLTGVLLCFYGVIVI